MSGLLTDLAAALASGAVEVIDLTAPLSETTPIIQLPPERGQPWPFDREAISTYDAAGPTVYWNNIKLSEHTGTHFDAPVHWLSGKDLHDVSQVPAGRLVGPAAVLDVRDRVAADPDFLLERGHVEAWQAEHGPLPDGGWLLYRTGWAERAHDPAAFLNDRHTPGISIDCARWLAEESPVVGVGVETVGTDAGLAGEFEQPYPCHWHLHGAGKYGLTQLRNLAALPPTGSVLIAGPLPIVGGSGSPTRVLALVERAG
ncbi:cyclase family protein [Nonomuraea gerenzanensis]|uniref:Putative cyclase family protein n=1 Tax=Nonomuraea gerenzanensis TaxID=93944 RepID=A0A1M4E9X7_9ACTN|nr:cyclase family protein [Nonomuraea gerenzanensis]UBU17873.1 cyclase family protein [Nonomuraea gerenzanensis]SBO95665.1 putative cyclase family protein [Nonomuraea gerenzanensis]